MPQCLPVRKGGRVYFFSNKTFALAARSKRVLQLGIHLHGEWSDVMDAVSCPGLIVHLKHHESRLWVIVENYLDRPQMVTYKTPLFSIQTEIEYCWVPDKGRHRITIMKGRGSIQETKQLHVIGEEKMLLTPDQISTEGLRRVFPNLFAEKIGCCRQFVVTSLGLSSDLPRFCQPQARVSGPQENQELQLAVDNLVREGVVEESRQELPHLIPIFAVKKPNGTTRVVLDFRLFNSCCRLLKYTGVHRLWMLAMVPFFRVGSQLDLRDSFHQIPLHSKVQKSFGFKLHNRYYFYKRLPQGWLNSPGFFVRALELTLKAAEDRLKKAGSSGKVFSYVDDILVLSQSKQEHARDMAIVLDQFERDGFTLRADKCNFMVASFQFLGYSLSSQGWEPNETLVGKLSHLSPPSTTKEWRAVVGWLHQLVPFLYDGMKIHYLLNRVRLTGKGWPEFLTTLHQQMVRLHHTVPKETFVIGIDASTLGWGATLSQSGRIILCCSGLWSTPLQTHFQKAIDEGSRVGAWSMSNECEAEGLRRALLVFRPYVWGLPVVVLSDNASVTSFNRFESCSPFVQRRLHVVLSICPQIRFVSGVANCLPDFLSRCHQFGCTFSELAVEARGIEISTQEVQPSSTISPELWHRLHSGHHGLATMLYRSKLWNLPVSKEALQDNLRKCRVCQRFQHLRRDSQLHSSCLAQYPGHIVSVDFIGPVNKKWILVVVDQFSRLVKLKVVTSVSGSVIQTGLVEWIQKTGTRMQMVQCDNAKGFGLSLFTWLHGMGVKVKFSNPYDHRSNGLVERTNRSVISRIGKLKLAAGGQQEWWELVAQAEEEVNHSYHRGLGRSPNCVWRARGQVLEDVRQRTGALRKEMNRGRVKKKTQFQVGDWVWLYRLKDKETGNWSKFEPPWEGPHLIVAKPGDHTYEVQLSQSGHQRKFKVHVDFLRPYV